MEKHKLMKPIDFEGQKITEINMDLDSLSAADLERCEKEARRLMAKGESVGLLENNKKYQCCVAAKASGLPLPAIRALGAQDYTLVCMLVFNFLLGGELDEEKETDDFFRPTKTVKDMKTNPTTAD